LCSRFRPDASDFFNSLLEALEAKIAPKAKVFAFISFDARELGAPSREDRLAAFKVELGIAPSDPIHEVSITFS
jgi:hypothetical protein